MRACLKPHAQLNLEHQYFFRRNTPGEGDYFTGGCNANNLGNYRRISVLPIYYEGIDKKNSLNANQFYAEAFRPFRFLV